MTLDCTCGAKNRIPSTGVTQRIRCGACKHVFTPRELVAAVPEAPPERPDPLAEFLKQMGIPRVTDAPDEGDYDE
jgi:hypothetical protein